MELGASGRRYNQVARAEGQQRTREALLDAAEREFFEGRFERVSLEELAASAGVTKQTLLRHFGSKDALLEQSASRGRGRVQAQRFGAPAGDVGRAVDNLLAHYNEDGKRALMIDTLEGRGGVAGEIVAEAKALHYDWVDHAFGCWLERLPAGARRRRRAALIALCDVHVWWLLSHDLGLSRADLRRTLVEAIERILIGAQPR